MGKLIHYFDRHLAGDHVPFQPISPIKKARIDSGLEMNHSIIKWLTHLSVVSHDTAFTAPPHCQCQFDNRVRDLPCAARTRRDQHWWALTHLKCRFKRQRGV